jgi:GntR family transcriptional regulator
MPRRYSRERSILSGDVERLKPSLYDDTPKYLQVARNLERLIRESRWSCDEVLPPERHLMAALGVSRTTARRAFQIAAEKGLIDRRPGLGTYVSKNRVSTTTVSAPMLEQLDAAELTISFEWLVRECGIAGAVECAVLTLPPKSCIARLRRLVSKNGRPMAIEFSRVSEHVLGQPLRIESSLYDELDLTEYAIVRVVRKFSAVHATPEHARLLEVAPKFALLLETRLGYDRHGNAIAFTELFCRPDVYDLVIESTRAPDPHRLNEA